MRKSIAVNLDEDDSYQNPITLGKADNFFKKYVATLYKQMEDKKILIYNQDKKVHLINIDKLVNVEIKYSVKKTVIIEHVFHTCNGKIEITKSFPI